MDILLTHSHYVVAVLGATNAFLVARDDKWFWWAFPVGILSEPFWLIETFMKAQWGMFALSIWYGYQWCRGAWVHRAKSPFFKGKTK